MGLIYRLLGTWRKLTKRNILFRIPINEYASYYPKLSDLFETTDATRINNMHTAYCTKCGVQFTRAALQQLAFVGTFGRIANINIRNSCEQGNDLRAGKCPNCGNSEMKIVAIEAPKDNKVDRETKNLLIDGGFLTQEGKYEEAIKYFDKAIERDPQNAKAWWLKGRALERISTSTIEQVILCYDRALEIDPHYSDAWFSKARHASNEEAIQYYDKAIESNPQDYSIWYYKGLALTDKNRYEEAIDCYDKAIEGDPRDLDYWHAKKLALEAIGRTTEAEAIKKRWGV